MKVFISWSGTISHKVAISLREWLPSVIQAVDPFVSSEDIERGARWFADIGQELGRIQFGILCITPQNLNAPWILFEAGALSKSVDQSRVSPLLIGVKNSDLKGPLSQFNTTSINKDEFFKLVKTINKQLGDSSLSEQTLEKIFSKWWPDLEASLEEAAQEANKISNIKEKPSRSQSELLEEILDLTRGISRQVTRNFNDLTKEQLYTYLITSRLSDNLVNKKSYLINTLKELKGIELNEKDYLTNFIIPELCEYQKKKKDDDTESDK